MERLIQDMMKRADISDEDLRAKSIIPLSEDEVLSWEYLVWVRKHPIVWNVPTHILYGEKDHFQTIDTIKRFSESVDADLTVMPNGEHWFHTDEQDEFRKKWLNSIQK